MALRTQQVDIPFVAGLDTKSDKRALQPPSLSVCTDVQFDDIGGIQTRPQFQAITDSASNTIADIRKIVAYGDELVAFSKDKLWSYASGDGLWTQRAEYLAVKIEEKASFVNTSEQFDCDRASLGGITMYVWTETSPTATLSYVAAVDTATGSVKLSPTSLGASTVRPRVTATATALVVTFYDGADLTANAYSPTALTVVGGDSITTTGGIYDVILHDAGTKLIGVANNATTGYIIFEISSTGSMSSLQTRTITTTGAMAIGMSPSASDLIFVTYHALASVYGDSYTHAGVAVTMDEGMGTASDNTVNQISTVWNPGDSNFYTFWSAGEYDGYSTTFDCEWNTCDGAGTTGTEDYVARRVGLASHAFVHDSAVYIWIVFAGASQGDLVTQVQNTYMLFRSDRTMIAKAVANQAGGFSASTGALPNVEDLGSGKFGFMGQYRRFVPLGQSQEGYAAKSPHDVTFTFDSNEARRVTNLGETLYIAGGQVSQYSGREVAEVGFNFFPWALQMAAGAAGNLNGAYNYKATWAWFNAKGEFERSSTATIRGKSLVNTKAVSSDMPPLTTTLKQGAAGECAIEFWRQVVNAPVGAPFYLVSSKDPASTGENAYIENAIDSTSITGLTDDLTDALLISRETNPENGGLTLASLSPPSATIIASTQDRLLISGISGYPYRVIYSKLRGPGEVAAFNDALFIDLPPNGGRITAIDFLNETMIVFTESAIYALPGDGYDNNGGGQNYGPARLIHSDVGAESAESVGLCSKGLLFKSKKGWYLLNHGWQANYVGAGAAEWDSESVLSVEATENQNQVRCVTSARIIIWDDLVDKWFEWGVATVDATIYQGTYHVVGSDLATVEAQALAYSGTGDLPQLDVETSWIKFAGLQGYKRCRRFYVLGEVRGLADLRIRVAYDYNESDAGGVVWTDDKTWTVAPTTIGGVLQVEHRPSQQKCQAMKVRITAQAPGVTTAPTTEAFDLTGLSFRFGVKQTGFKGLAVAQKQ